MTGVNVKRTELDQLIGTEFEVTAEEGSACLRFVEIFDHPCPPEFESFSLFFESGLDALFQQGTYLVSHAQLGEFPIFIVPIAQTDGGYRYEAVFNRPLPAVPAGT